MARGWLLGVVSFSLVVPMVRADSERVWSLASPADIARANAARTLPDSGAVYRLDRAAQQAVLSKAPLEFSAAAAHAPIVMLPRPDGLIEAFEVVESPIMEPPLAAKYPQIRTYSAQGIDDPAATARLCLNELGFFATVLSPDGDYSVAPSDLGADAVYSSAFTKNQVPPSWECGTTGEPVETPLNAVAAVTGDKLRTYRVAVSMDPQVCVNVCGGTVAGGLSGVTTAVNALNALWEKEFSIRLIVIADNDQIIFTNTGSHPFDTSGRTEMMQSNGTVLSTYVGLNSFDVGHVFSRFGGGVANLGVVCTGNKSNGLTGISSFSTFSNPQTFYHEMGHQFNAPHSWNGAGGSCTAEQWSGSAAYEPGSGSTIMSYAGSCSPDNVQNFRDNYYSQGSVQQITDFSASRTCSEIITTGNGFPTAQTSVINQAPIPIGTPFELTGSATDPDGDTLTFTWEQRDTGQRRSLSAGDAGNGPLFRSFPPSTTGNKRVFPKLSTVLTGNLSGSLGEIMPTTTRFMRFRMTARDNRAGGGGQNYTEALIRSYSANGPFKITEPNTSASKSGAAVIRWLVGGTQTSPFGHTKVNILLSTDGGNTFPTVLASDTPNDGVEAVALPQTATNCRIRVQPVNAIYFDISDASFSITSAPNAARLESVSPVRIDDAFANGNGNGIAEPGESKLRVYLDVLSSGLVSATNVHATLSTTTPTATVLLSQLDYPDMPQGSMAAGMLPAVIAIDPAHPCGTPIALKLVVTASEGNWTLNYSLPTGNSGVCVPAASFCPGDFNSDGFVDDADFVIFAGAYNELTNPAGDLTGDTLTDDLDFVEFVAGYDALICP
ncbi:MAG: hypothetical protein KF691_14395 [Phycisphaeraceae bacterium]|nr:hypothetical protein [Phycisphaeraceae bacterium]